MHRLSVRSDRVRATLAKLAGTERHPDLSCFFDFRMKVLLYILIRSFTFEMAIPAEKFEKKAFIVTRPYLKGNNEAGAQMPLIVKPYKR